MGGRTDAESTSEFKGQFHVGITIVLLHRAVKEYRQDGVKGHGVHGHESVSEQDESRLRGEDLGPGWFGFLCRCCWTSSSRLRKQCFSFCIRCMRL